LFGLFLPLDQIQLAICDEDGLFGKIAGRVTWSPGSMAVGKLSDDFTQKQWEVTAIYTPDL
jgi:hypothetical protein